MLDGPAGLYLTGEDHLRVTTFNGTAGVILAIEARLLDCEGRLVALAETHTPNTDRTSRSTTIRLAEGFLTNLHVRASSGSPLAGSCFVLVELVRGFESSGQLLGTLLQGYASATQRLAWPGSEIAGSTSGRGALRAVVGTDPAAGAEVVETVPAGARWRLASLSLTLVTSATVATRRPVLLLDDGANIYAAIASVGTQAASLTGGYTWTSGGYGDNNVATANLAALPVDCWLPAGHRFRTSTVAIQAGDNYGAPVYLIEEQIAG